MHHRPVSVGAGDDAPDTAAVRQRRRLRIPASHHQRHHRVGDHLGPDHVRGEPARAPARGAAIRAARVVQQPARRRPPHGEGVPRPGTGGGGPRRQVRPILRPGAGERPAADTDRVQDAGAAVEQDLHLQRQGHQLGARGDGVRRGPGPQGGVPGEARRAPDAGAVRREAVVLPQGQEPDEPGQGQQPPDTAGDDGALEPDKSKYPHHQSKREKIHAIRNKIQAAGVLEKRYALENSYNVCHRFWEISTELF